MRALLFLITINLLFNSCSSDGNKLNFFSIEDDKKLGAQLAQQIESGESGVEVLDTTKYAEAYKHLYRIRNYILQSEKIQHKNDFEWRVRIIKNDTMLNAFATPGGYIYVYTGLIKFLDTEDQMAGVLGHEIAHADQRHSTAMLTKVYGIDLLLSIVLGNDYAAVRQVGENLLSLSFSRDAEQDADRLSVEYLCQGTAQYEADGVSGFFTKLMKEEKDGSPIEFLSTHPSPPNRIEKINAFAEKLKCDTATKNPGTYQLLKNSLP